MDYRGTGESGEPDKPYSTAGFAEDVIVVLDALEIGTADVYGTSMGDRRMPAHAMRGHLIASDEHDAWDELPKIQAETLILHGDADRLAPVRNVELLAERIPDARLHVFPGARHAYFHEARATASELVMDFLDE